MAHIIWTNKLSVGIKRIDDQHLKLIEYINLLEDFLRLGKSQKILYKVLYGLELYAINHFDTEEDLMKKYNFEESSMHKKEHEKFTNIVREFKNKYDSGNTEISEDILIFLHEWLINHIKSTDKKLGRALNKIGMT